MGLITAEHFSDWMPIRVSHHTGGAIVDWCYMERQRFTHPFFDITVHQQMSAPFNMLFHHETLLDDLHRQNEAFASVPPTGFIFHMSRCGSTLVSQMLAALPQNIVISEAAPINSVLQIGKSDPHLTDEKRIERFRAAVEAFGRKRFAEEEYYFVKFDSWNSVDLEFIREAFPEVPWIYLFREPLEVIVSQMRERGAQMVPGSLGHVLPGVDLPDAWQMQPEEYCSRVLERFCAGAINEIERDGSNALAVNYTGLPEAMFELICPHFKVKYSPEDEEQMMAATKRDAKSPTVDFKPDSKTKREAASDAARSAAEKVRPLYEKLEKLSVRISK